MIDINKKINFFIDFQNSVQKYFLIKRRFPLIILYRSIFEKSKFSNYFYYISLKKYITPLNPGPGQIW